MDLSAIALQGLGQAEDQLNAAANALANAGTNTPGGAKVDVVDLSAEILALNSAQTAFAVNVSTLKTADQIQQSTLELIG
jgi:flagellar basal body rod protein FlgG